MQNINFTELTSFAEVCTAMGRNAGDFAIPENGTAKEMADICLQKIILLPLAANGGVKVNMADTDQVKFFPVFEIIPEDTRPFGFRLSVFAYGSDFDDACLGARPVFFLKREDAIHAGKTYEAEYTEWHYRATLANQQ